MKKEEILAKSNGFSADEIENTVRYPIEQDVALSAMSEFAEQEAIAFADWTQKNYYEHDDNGLWYKWLLRNRNEDPSYTTIQLYQLYKRETKNKL